MLKWTLGNKWVWVAIACLAVAGGFSYGYFHQDMGAFLRSGSLVVGAGIVLIANAAINGADLSTVYDEHGNRETDKAFWDALGLSVPAGVLRNKSALLAVNWLGPITGLIGTVISGYGDLLNCVFAFAKCAP